MNKLRLLCLLGIGSVLNGATLVSPSTSCAKDPSSDWYQWRGPNRDGISTEKNLLASWPEDGPTVVYRIKGLGSGMASVSVADGKFYTMGNIDGKTNVICRNQSDGQLVWQTPFTNAQGDPNCTPTVDLESGLVYALSHDGVLACCSLKDGNVLWKKSFTQDFGGKMESGWGYSESPLVDGDSLICTPGAPDAMVVSLDKKSGKTIWAGKAPTGDLRGNDGAGYASVVISNAAGVKQYVQLVGHGVVSYSAASGELLWNYDRIANRTANIPTPIVKDNFVFCSTGYDDGGTALLEIKKRGKGLEVKEVYYKTSKELQNHHGGMIMIGNYVFMGHGHNNGFPACVEWKTGKNLWEKSRGPGSGSAAIVAADKKLYFRYQDGVMALIDTDAKKYKLVSQFKLPMHNGESWPHPVIVSGQLLVRDQDELACFSIAK